MLKNPSVQLLAALLAISPPAYAAAPGINLSWDSCSGPTNKDFACNSNTGTEVLVASFVAPSGIVEFDGVDADITLGNPGDYPVLADWWNFQTSACRSGSLGFSLDQAGDAGCANAWLPGASGGVGEQPYPQTGQWAITAFGGQAPPGPTLTAGQEYFAFRVIVNNLKASGADTCGGCSKPTTLRLQSITIRQASPPFVILTAPVRQTAVTWQGGLVPTVPITWGRIKQMYR